MEYRIIMELLCFDCCTVVGRNIVHLLLQGTCIAINLLNYFCCQPVSYFMPYSSYITFRNVDVELNMF